MSTRTRNDLHFDKNSFLSKDKAKCLIFTIYEQIQIRLFDVFYEYEEFTAYFFMRFNYEKPVSNWSLCEFRHKIQQTFYIAHST